MSYKLISDILDNHCTTLFNRVNGDEEINSSKDAVIEAIRKYGEEVLKIAAEKAKIKRNYYPNNQSLESQTEQREFDEGEYIYFISKESIINCLK